MLEFMVAFFVSFFKGTTIAGVGLAIGFGIVWLAGYWPPLFKKYWLWAVMVGSALLTIIAVTFIQIPLQTWTMQSLNQIWSQEFMIQWALVIGIPNILYSGLVQEGSKLVPVVVYWWRNNKTIDPRLALAVGAVAGAGFGIFEAQWAHNNIFAAGWTWAAVNTNGVIALAGFQCYCQRA